MSLTSALEREIKLEADPGFTIPDLRDLLEGTVRLPEENLWATYYDTSDLRLWQRGIVLRHRTGEEAGPGIWTIKLPDRGGPGPSLNRQELRWSGPPDAVPDAAAQILQGIIRRGPLQEIAGIETLRRRLTLRGPSGATLGELDDDTVTIHGGPNDGNRFRQIELEIEYQDTELTERVLDRLHAAGARTDRTGPKLARALDVSRIPIEKAGPVGRKGALGEVVQASIASALERLLDHEYMLRADVLDPPAHDIHQTRVASRRLRSDLKTFGEVLDPLWVRRTRRDLRWIGSVLGAVRDIDVLKGELDAEKADGFVDQRGHALLSSALGEERKWAARNLAEALSSERFIVLLDKLHAAAQRPPFMNSQRSGQVGYEKRASKSLPRVLRRSLKRLHRQLRRAESHPDDRDLHRIRIRAKQLRYACEASSAVMGKRARKLARAAERLQTELGTHHDAVEAERWLRAEALHGSGPIAFSAGQLTTEQRLRQRMVRRHWRAASRRVTRKARWLGK